MPSNVLTYLYGPFMNVVLALVLLRRFFLLYSVLRSDVSCERSSSRISPRPLFFPTGACIHWRLICLSSVLNFLILTSLWLHSTSFIRLSPVFFNLNISFPLVSHLHTFPHKWHCGDSRCSVLAILGVSSRLLFTVRFGPSFFPLSDDQGGMFLLNLWNLTCSRSSHNKNQLQGPIAFGTSLVFEWNGFWVKQSHIL